MNKKILKKSCVLAIFCLVTNSTFVMAKKENFKVDIIKDIENKLINKEFRIKQNSKEKLHNTFNEIDLKVENFKTNIIKKEGIIFVLYEHIKSGSKIIVYFKNDEESMDISSSAGIHFDITPKNNKGIINIISQMLNNEMIKELRKNYDSGSLANTGKLKGFTYPMVEPSYYGLGFDVAIQEWTPKMVKILANELKNPKFMNDNGEKLDIAKDNVRLNFLYSEKDWNNKKNRGDYEASKFFNERFVGGLFTNFGEMKEIDNLKREEINNFYIKNVIPANSLIIMSYDMNRNFKEILQLMDKEYFRYYDKKNKVIEKNNINELINTEYFRKYGVDTVKYITTDCSTGMVERKTKDDAKSAVKLTWDLKNFSVLEQDVFKFMSFKFEEFIEKTAKEIGYLSAKISYDDVNRLFYIILYSKEKNEFQESKMNKVREDSKKILTKVYEEINKANYEKLEEIYITSVIPDNILEYTIRNYRNRNILSLIYKSFNETREPFNKNFFDIEDDIILDDIDNKRFLENVKKYKGVLEKVINMPVTFVDSIYEQKKNVPKYPFKLQCCFPININVKYDVLRNIVSEIIMNEFLIPNLHEKKHIPIDKMSCMPVHNKKNELKLEVDAFRVVNDEKFVEEMKSYLTKELPEKLKNYNFTEEILNKEKEKLLFSLDEELKYKMYCITKEKKILNNKKNIKRIALSRKNSNNRQLKNLNKEIEENEQKLKDKNINDKLRKEVEKIIEKQIEDRKKYYEKNNLEKLIEEVKKEKSDLLGIDEKEKKEIEENIKSIKNINLDDLKSAVQSIKIPNEIYLPAD